MNLLSWVRSFVGSEIPPTPAASHPPAAVRGTGALAVERALSVVGQGRYRLGRGGRSPESPTPFDAAGLCDCSGALAWFYGLDRYQPGRIAGDWISSKSVHDDALAACRLFRRVRLEDARPGDTVVYPSLYRGKVRTRVGHVGLVVAVNGPGWPGLDVVDCAARKGAAVGHRTGTLWGAKDGIVARAV